MHILRTPGLTPRIRSGIGRVPDNLIDDYRDNNDQQDRLESACSHVQASRGETSGAAGQQHKKDDDCERIRGVSKEKNEALDQRNFHEDVTESYGD